MAKSFWTFKESENYDIGLTGTTVYIFDKEGNEVAKFKDLTYAYRCVISPKGDIFVVKSNAGRMAIYSLESLNLIKKFRYSKIDHSQDENLIFSPDGYYLYNIENHIDSLRTCISVYETYNFSLVKKLLFDNVNLFLERIEYDKSSDEYFLLGYLRNTDTRVAEKFFVGKLKNEELEDQKCINERTYTDYVFAKMVEDFGFTQKAFEWSLGLFLGNHDIKSLEQLKSKDLSLASLWVNTTD